MTARSPASGCYQVERMTMPALGQTQNYDDVGAMSAKHHIAIINYVKNF